MSVTVYMAAHTEHDILNYSYIKPIQVGAFFSEYRFYDTSDYTGDNISDRNKKYCELTALYWIWKNSSDKYVGLCHYRRFFNTTKNDILNAISHKKVVVPKIAHLGRSLEKQYLHNHCRHPWEIMLHVLEEKYPDYHISSKRVFGNNRMYPYNMFIAQKSWLDAYCTWLFDILFKVEKLVDMRNQDEYQMRYMGFLAERLFTLYIFHNNVDVKECRVVNDIKKALSPGPFHRLRNDIYYNLFGGSNEYY